MSTTAKAWRLMLFAAANEALRLGVFEKIKREGDSCTFDLLVGDRPAVAWVGFSAKEIFLARVALSPEPLARRYIHSRRLVGSRATFGAAAAAEGRIRRYDPVVGGLYNAAPGADDELAALPCHGVRSPDLFVETHVRPSSKAKPPRKRRGAA
jgi:hypothetical protein